MTAPFLHTQTPTRVTVSLLTVASKDAASSGPDSRTLVIPRNGSVPVGRASTCPTKNRQPASNNALFACAVKSRAHALISAPNGPHGSIFIEDTGSMHGVYVNGRKVLRTEISRSDEIMFGSQVTRAEATHDGVKVKVIDITRDGATFSNIIDLAGSSNTLPPPSYRVPDYDTDSSKDDSINGAFAKPSPLEYINLEPTSSSDHSHNRDFVHSEDESFDNGSDSEFESDYEGNDYPDNPDELDDDEQSLSGSDLSGAHSCCQDWDEYAHDEIISELDEPLETQEEPQTAPVHVALHEPKVVRFQVEEKEKARDAAEEIMSIPWLVESSNTVGSTATMTPNSTMLKVPSLSVSKDANLPPLSPKKHAETAVIAQDKDESLDSQCTLAESQPVSSERTTVESAKLSAENDVAAPTPTAAELYAKVDSPAGSKRKRETEDDGREQVSAPSTGRKLLKLRFGQKHTLKDFFGRQVHTTPRPIKRAKHSTARTALSAFAGAIGGVATVVGVLMTPQCEQLLANWPMP